jgi:esterase/lipase superfamily enzyme
MIESPAMGRRVHVWCFGHWGAPLVVFPSAAGFAHEWDRQGMVEALAPLINAGKLKLYCPESNVSRSWTNKEEHPAIRLRHHAAYEAFLLETLVPWIRQDCVSPEIRVAAAGTSLGAFYAANMALKYPETFHYALCMSGRYEASQFFNGFSNDEIYYNNPIAFTSSLQGESLEKVRQNTHLSLVCGQGAWEEGCIEETQILANILQAKGIAHYRDIWGHDVSHDWVWWQRQAMFHLSKTFG